MQMQKKTSSWDVNLNCMMVKMMQFILEHNVTSMLASSLSTWVYSRVTGTLAENESSIGRDAAQATLQL